MLREANRDGENSNSVVFNWILDDELAPIGEAQLLCIGRNAQLRDIEVKEEYRGKGIGTEFVLDILFELRQRGYETMFFRLLPSSSKPLYRIAESLGMEMSDSGATYYKFWAADLKELEKIKVKGTGFKNIRSATAKEKEMLSEQIALTSYCPISNPLYSVDLDEDISFLHMDGEAPDAAIFIERKDEGLYISFLWSIAEKNVVIQQLLASAYQLGVKKYGMETIIEAASVSDKMEKFFENLLGKGGEPLREITSDLISLDDFLDDDDEDEEENLMYMEG